MNFFQVILLILALIVCTYLYLIFYYALHKSTTMLNRINLFWCSFRKQKTKILLQIINFLYSFTGTLFLTIILQITMKSDSEIYSSDLP